MIIWLKMSDKFNAKPALSVLEVLGLPQDPQNNFTASTTASLELYWRCECHYSGKYLPNLCPDDVWKGMLSKPKLQIR